MISIAKLASVMILSVTPVISAQVNAPASTDVTHTPVMSEETVLMPTKETSTQDKQISNADIKTLTKTYFAEHPLLAEIAFCESTLRHYNADGSVLRGKVDSADVGLMQINERYHKENAQKLGYDIYTPEGNMGYAIWLYEHQGSQPWSASAPCWKNR